MHSRDVELEVLDRVLAGLDGELSILSEPLREALAARRLRAATPAGGPGPPRAPAP